MPQYIFKDKSILVRVMAWCRQATSALTQIYVAILRHKSTISSAALKNEYILMNYILFQMKTR